MSGQSQNNSKRTPVLGCIADDVTGATDLAINLVQGGMCVVQLLGIPSVDELAQLDADAVVVGLKTRSIPSEEAIQQSLACLRNFTQFGIGRIFFKYCSTFDSTAEGNIGPVAAALLDELDARQTVFCPAFPQNGRTVYQGHLFVYNKLLNESGMENHPLNPMTDANLVRFLGKQCDRRVGLLKAADLESISTVAGNLSTLANDGYSFVVTDACNNEHLTNIASAIAWMPLVTGGSGIGRYLPEAYRETDLLRTSRYEPTMPRFEGRSLVIAGSCSSATNRQVAWMQSKIPCWTVDVAQLIEQPEQTLGQVMAWARENDADAPLLISSSALPDQVAEIQGRHGASVAAEAIESFLSDVATKLVSDLGVGRLVVAGGETSGAVVSKLGIRALRIGPEICPGVPWTETMGDQRLALALKSGNFGEDDFFERALELLS